MKILIISLVYLLSHLSATTFAENQLENSPDNLEERGLGGKTKCYGDEIGCFTNEGWYFPGRPFNLLPASRSIINTRFYLYTKANIALRHQIKTGEEMTVKKSNFTANRPTKIIIHGFLDHGAIPWVKDIATQYVTKSDVNAIAVDWGNAAGFPYTQATANTRLVGREVALLITFLKDRFGLKPDDVHIIGHSLGAHTAGYAGEKMRENGHPIGRITGLDPAEPLFQDTAPFVILDPTDAKYVDVIHTDIRHLVRLGYGMSVPVGHLDIYPNGGKIQPGCDQSIISHLIIDGLFDGIRQTVACNHLRVNDFYEDSIRNDECPLLAIECPSYTAFKNGECWDCGKNYEHCAEMGNRGDRFKPGTRKFVNMYLDTAERPPYCLYHYQVEVKLLNNANAKDQAGRMYVTVYGDKGKIVKAELNTETKTLIHGQTYKFLFTNSIDVGKITRIEFFWRYYGQILNPLTWGIFRKPMLFVDKINVRSITRQFGTLFCDSLGPAEADVQRVLYPKTSCQ